MTARGKSDATLSKAVVVVEANHIANNAALTCTLLLAQAFCGETIEAAMHAAWLWRTTSEFRLHLSHALLEKGFSAQEDSQWLVVSNTIAKKPGQDEIDPQYAHLIDHHWFDQYAGGGYICLENGKAHVRHVRGSIDVLDGRNTVQELRLAEHVVRSAENWLFFAPPPDNEDKGSMYAECYAGLAKTVQAYRAIRPKE
jgi:hypothetical protein